MIFTGHAEITIDPKQRLAIPAKYRAQLDPATDGQVWFCVPWPGNGLLLFTEKTFTSLAASEPGTLTPIGEESELETSLFGLTERLEMDAAGRITIPKLHQELTGLSSEVVVVGSRLRLEVRDRAAWKASMHERFNKLASQAMRLKLEGQNTRTKQGPMGTTT